MTITSMFRFCSLFYLKISHYVLYGHSMTHDLISSKANRSGGLREDCPNLLKANNRISVVGLLPVRTLLDPATLSNAKSTLTKLQRLRTTLILKRRSAQWTERRIEGLRGPILCTLTLMRCLRIQKLLEPTERMEGAILLDCIDWGYHCRLFF